MYRGPGDRPAPPAGGGLTMGGFVARETRAAELREEAARHDREAAESFERCDTDGFLSQWASGLIADRLRLAAELVEAGGRARFPALFTLDGRYVPARRIESRHYGWGDRWMVLDANGRATGEFLPYWPKRRETLAARGYTEGYVTEPATAELRGKGTNVGAVPVPLYEPWEGSGARRIVTTDRFEEVRDA